MSGAHRRPRFDELPVLEELGLRHAWNVQGYDDQLGTIALLTPARVVAAASLVRRGQIFNLALPLTEPDPPLWGREPLRHTVYRSGRNEFDDRIDSFYPQGSSQWDGLRHVHCREFGFYGGSTTEPTHGPGHLGIEYWADHGIVGRGVLLDLARHMAASGNHYDALADTPIRPEVLAACADAQEVALTEGDILCLRFGWVTAYRALDRAGREAYGEAATFAGLHAGEDTARFLWDGGVAAVVCDNPAVEDAPGSREAGSLHRRLLPLLGFAVAELFDLDRLSDACVEDGRWDFLFMAAPLNLPGGVGSPGNAVAVR